RLGEIASALRDIANRLVRGLRKRRAVAQLQGRRIERVVVLCQANLCRSPFAAAMLAAALKRRGAAGIEVTSAGLLGTPRESPAMAVAVAREWNVDLSMHQSSRLTPQTLREADLIIVMSPDQAR